MHQELDKSRIPELQNEPVQIARLAAQRGLHSKEKQIVFLQLFITAIVPVVLSYLLLGNPRLPVWIAFGSAIIALTDALVLDRLQKHFRTQAVRIQELFDTEVLSLEWPRWHLGDKPDPETVAASGASYLARHGSETIKNWYPTAAGRLPLPWARIVCQRSNLWYEVALRQKYMNYLAALIATAVLVPFMFSLAKQAGVNELVLMFVSPLLPIILWSIREESRHRASLRQNENLKGFVNGIIDQDIALLEESTLEQYARFIQDGILVARLTKPPLFDWYYRLCRKSNEELMEKGTEQLVNGIMGRLANE